MAKVPSNGGKPTQSIEFILLIRKGFKAHFSTHSALEEEESSPLIHPFYNQFPKYIYCEINSHLFIWLPPRQRRQM